MWLLLLLLLTIGMDVKWYDENRVKWMRIQCILGWCCIVSTIGICYLQWFGDSMLVRGIAGNADKQEGLAHIARVIKERNKHHFSYAFLFIRRRYPSQAIHFRITAYLICIVTTRTLIIHFNIFTCVIFLVFSVFSSSQYLYNFGWFSNIYSVYESIICT